MTPKLVSLLKAILVWGGALTLVIIVLIGFRTLRGTSQGAGSGQLSAAIIFMICVGGLVPTTLLWQGNRKAAFISFLGVLAVGVPVAVLSPSTGIGILLPAAMFFMLVEGLLRGLFRLVQR